MKKKPSKELFLKVLENAPECEDEENDEIMTDLNSMTEEDKKIVKTEVVTWYKNK